MDPALGFPGSSSLIHCADSWGAISWVLSLGAITIPPVANSAKVSIPPSCLLAAKLSRKGGDKGHKILEHHPLTSTALVSTRKGEGGAGGSEA